MHVLLPTLVVLVLVAGGCGGDGSTTTTPVQTPRQSEAPATAQATPTADADARQSEDRVEGTVVRFSRGDVSVDVTIGEDNPTSRDFLSRLPATITIEEFAGREKISYLKPELDTTDSPGSDPEDGHLIYFVPWGNLGFYYNAEGIDYSDDTIHLGTYEATREKLAQLEGEVTVRRVED